MKNRKFKRAAAFVLSLYTLTSALSVSAFASDTTYAEELDTAPALSENVQVSSRLYELFFGKSEEFRHKIHL